MRLTVEAAALWAAVPVVRLGMAAAVGAVLYCLLGDSVRPLRARWAWRAMFAAAGMVVVLHLSEPQPEIPGAPGRAFQAFEQGVLAARRAFASNPLIHGLSGTPGSPDDPLLVEAIQEYERARRASPESPAYARDLAALYAAANRWRDAGRAWESYARLVAPRRPETAVAAREAWRAIDRADPGAMPEAARRLTAARPGWTGDVLLYAAERRAGRKQEADRVLARLGQDCNGYVLRVAAATLLYVGVLLLGCAAAILFAILAARRALPRVPPQRHPVAPLLLEAFLIYMLLYSLAPVSQVVALLVRSGTLPQAAGTMIWAAVGGDLLAFLPLFYLSFRLRKKGLSLAEIGLRAARPVVEIGWGVAAYVATSPLIVLVALATGSLSERFFPNVAPPYHPVLGMMASDQGTAFRVGLFLLMVVGAGLLEEIYFRGCLYGALRRRWGFWASAVLSSSVFALLHPQLPIGFISIFLLGFVFAVLAEWRQSLIPGMVMHALNNGVIFLLLSALFPLHG